MKTLIVGDIHGDWGKLNALMQKKQPDIVLQCGDFGWWPQWQVVDMAEVEMDMNIESCRRNHGNRATSYQ